MKIILVALAAMLFNIHALGQAHLAPAELDLEQRLDVARQLVVSPDAGDRTSSMSLNILQAQIDSYQKIIDKAYPNLDALTRLRVLKAYEEVAARYADVFSRMFSGQVDATSRQIASKYSLVELKRFLELSRGKKTDALGLLTSEELREVETQQLAQIKPDIERLVNDFLAVHSRLVQQGVLPK